jgi:hypothetical protein
MNDIDAEERAAIEAEGCGRDIEPTTKPHPHLRVVTGDRNELEINTTLIRGFLGIGETEPIELTSFVEGRINVAHARTEQEHVRLLREAQRVRGFCGCYQLVNGPLDSALLARYQPGQWSRAFNGRATDRDIGKRRAVFIDTDPVRPKGISATTEQQREAWEVSAALEDWLADVVRRSALGHGSSGNGFFTLIALEPCDPTPDTAKRIAQLLGLLQKKFGTERVKIDTSVFNAARLMPCPGTMKRKGVDTPERPHRMTSFSCSSHVTRVPLEALC